MFKRIEDATAYWLYAGDGSYEEWPLDGEPVVSPDGNAVRLRFRLEEDSFQLIVRQSDGSVFVKHDGSDDPRVSIPALLTGSDDQCIILFREADQTVFLQLFLSG